MGTFLTRSWTSPSMQVDQSFRLIGRIFGLFTHLARFKNSKLSPARSKWRIKEKKMTFWSGGRKATYWLLWIDTTLCFFGTLWQASSSTWKCSKNTTRYKRLTSTSAMNTRPATKTQPTYSMHTHRLSSASKKRKEVKMTKVTAIN